MDRADHQLDGWRPIVLALCRDDDAGLVALANRGLVRRAKKDAEREPAVIVEVTDDTVTAVVSQETVQLNRIPGASTCSCPASGCCRHILSAWVSVADALAADVELEDTESAAAEALVADELSAIDDAELRGWLGKKLFDEALREIALGATVTFQLDEGFGARIDQHGQQCRWVPGSGVTAMVCSCHAPTPCLHRAMAIIAWQVHAGQRDIDTVAQTEATASSGTPRTRVEILDALKQWIGDFIHHGFARLNEASAARLTNLATSAHGVDLPRLELGLRRLAGEIGAWLNHDSHVSAETLLDRAATVNLIRSGLIHSVAGSVGEHRQRYHRVGTLDLSGVGARVWETRSGYQGVTVYFWDDASNVWNTWSDARRGRNEEFDPRRRYRADGPWQGCRSPALACRSRVRLLNAWRSSPGRLSARQEVRAIVQEATSLDRLPIVSDFTELLSRARAGVIGGFAASENSSLVLIQPAQWGMPRFDDIAQELRVSVCDAQRRALDVVLVHDTWERDGISWLEKQTLAEGTCVFGNLELRRGALVLRPISLLTDGHVISLTALPREADQEAEGQDDPSSSTESTSGDTDDDSEELVLTDSSVARVLGAVRAELEQLAEGGVPGFTAQRVRDIERQAGALGLARLGLRLRSLVDALTTSATRCTIAEAVLSLYALTGVYAKIEVLEEATATWSP